eukprot:gene20196-26940_t
MDDAQLDSLKEYTSNYINERCQSKPNQFGEVRLDVVRGALLKLVELAIQKRRAAPNAMADTFEAPPLQGPSLGLAPPVEGKPLGLAPPAVTSTDMPGEPTTVSQGGVNIHTPAGSKDVSTSLRGASAVLGESVMKIGLAPASARDTPLPPTSSSVLLQPKMDEGPQFDKTLEELLESELIKYDKRLCNAKSSVSVDNVSGLELGTRPIGVDFVVLIAATTSSAAAPAFSKQTPAPNAFPTAAPASAAAIAAATSAIYSPPNSFAHSLQHTPNNAPVPIISCTCSADAISPPWHSKKIYRRASYLGWPPPPAPLTPAAPGDACIKHTQQKWEGGFGR